VSRPNSDAKLGHIVIFSDRSDRAYTLEVRLRSEGFRLTTAESVDSLMTICSQKSPDVLILRSYSHPRDLVTTLKYLMKKGVSPSKIPTLLLVRNALVQFLVPLIQIGFKEIVSLDTSVDTLIHKIKQLHGGFAARTETKTTLVDKQSGSRGNLSGFSIIDLLQALGPSQRTARIKVTPEDPSSDSLLMYLSRGLITYAKLGDLLAERAIYRALTWETGTWTSEPVAEKDLPEPNNTLPNEFILMEGCRLIDENGRQALEEAAASA
jgi:DNA-binding NarL/FixJ family response regulator